MSNSSETEYEKRFQEDLAKATALSLEQQVLDDIRRNRKYGTTSSITDAYDPDAANKFMKELRDRSQRETSNEFNTLRTNAPATTTVQRRHSEIGHKLPSLAGYNSTSRELLKTPTDTLLSEDKATTENDLISFSNPFSKTVADFSFDDIIKDFQENSTISKPTAEGIPSNTMSVYPYAGGITPSEGATALCRPHAAPSHMAGMPPMQLVPFTSATQQQKKPLTNDELQKLYNMPQIPQTGFVSAVPYNTSYYGLPSSAAAILPYQRPYSAYPHVANTLPAASAVGTPFSNIYNNVAHPQSFGMPQFTSHQASSVEPNESASAMRAITANSSISDLSAVSIRRPTTSVKSKPLGNDLIDLSEVDDSRVSVLEAFDPLLNESDDAEIDNVSECDSYYPEYDPFDFLYSGGSSHYSDPVYDAVNKSTATSNLPVVGWRSDLLPDLLIYSQEKPERPEKPKKTNGTESSPPPLPPRSSNRYLSREVNEDNASSKQATLDRRKSSARLYELITETPPADLELLKFYQMVKDLRMKYSYDDEATNKGHITASEFKYFYQTETSIKVLVHPALNVLLNCAEAAANGKMNGYGAPVVFTCDIETTAEMVISQAFCSLEGQIMGNVNDYAVKPIGVSEWLSPSSKLSQLEYVHNSLKLEKDVQLGLCFKTEKNMKAIARTQKDDLRDAKMLPEDILPIEMVFTVNYDNMMILIETLELEIDKLESVVTESKPVLSCSGVIQAVKAICALLGSIDTLEISAAVAELKRICDDNSIKIPDAINEANVADMKPIDHRLALDQIKIKCNCIRDAVLELVDLYSNVFRVGFSVKTNDFSTVPLPIANVSQPFMVNVNCLHRHSNHWNFDEYLLSVNISYGTRFISDPIVLRSVSDPYGSFFRRLNFSKWLTFEKNPICTLPKEARMIFVLYGNKLTDNEPASTTDDANGERRQIPTELSWCAVQLFDFKNEMVCGAYLLSMWPPTTDKFLGPAPARGCHPQPDFCPVLSIDVPSYGGYIQFPEPIDNPTPALRYDFNSLDDNLQQELLETVEQGYPGACDKREVFWEKRFYLQKFPNALAKVLHAAHSWDYASLMDLHSLLYSWAPLAPLQAFELLLPRYPDDKVRQKAVEWISKLPNDQLVDYLPQLLQALKHDTYEASAMARFLLSRSLESPRIAHHMYWLLCNSLPGPDPQNSLEDLSWSTDLDDILITQARYYRRNKMMLRALLAICGEELLNRFLRQSMMCQNLAKVAEEVKEAKESLRQKTLCYHMETVHQGLAGEPSSLPLGPELEVIGVIPRNCSYFNSNTLPLKVSYKVPDGEILPAIFKQGDDLQQDMLTIQLIRVMNKWWLAEGLDLKMVTFNCVPTGCKRGMIEMVNDAETLRKIQIEYGLTGSFKDRPIAEWLAKQNPSQLEYQRAVKNFTVSCAGYSVATYILGICDRHNDNIMLKTSGHLFHIDFGKFLGDAQMFGNFKRDRTPFVLTSDMVYVINGGDKFSTEFHYFVDLCCRAFNIIRKHSDLILNLLALMATAGIPGVTADAVTYVRRALLPNQSNPEAAASFAKMIQFSLKNWFTQFNFFLHNISQMRFSNDEGNGELLSFVPRIYTIQQDGRLKSVMVVRCQKRYDMEKYYTYILRVTRHGQPDPTHLFRSYKEFTEFHQKLCLHFPLAKLHSLPSGIHVGRSNVKSVAEKRLVEIRNFLRSLFNSTDEIAHSDLVYTFFHPILRDQQEANLEMSKVKETKTLPSSDSSYEKGQIKLSLQYRRCALTVMIHHAKGLPTLQGGQEPNTYVKCYLKPDPTKITKRKTKVVRKSCVPSFMETLEYRMPLANIQNRILHVTVWSHDTLQENELLGGFTIDLSRYDLRKELIDWFHLGPMTRNFLKNF